MTDRDQSLEPGLYFVSTPIGSARDITLRGLDILAKADVLAAEDTRNTRRLLDIHGVRLEGRPLIPYHDHNGKAQRPKLLAYLQAGKSVACVSDAGTPLIADPGFALARDAQAENAPVFAAPGASALLAALVVAGLPTDRFYFAGFPPPKTKARQAFLREIANVPGTLVFYESPKRVGKTLSDMAHTLGEDRPAALCRELTKKFEQVHRASLVELATTYATTPPKGEIVLVVGAASQAGAAGVDDVDTALSAAFGRQLSVRDAVDEVAGVLSLPRKLVYQRALELDKKR